MSDNLLAEYRREAIILLGRRPYSRIELIKRLTAKGAESEIAEQVVERLVTERLVNDEELAGDAVRMQATKLIGRREVRRRVMGKGLPEAAVESELEEQYDSAAELDAARQFAEKKMRLISGLPKETKWRRVGAALDRRGFPAGVIRKVLDELNFDEEL